MGILDDAIREHLDLKRRQGAEDSELARLEDEAFGPPSRPGDPDFPAERTEAAAAVAEPATGETAADPGASSEAPSEELGEAPPTPEPQGEPATPAHAEASGDQAGDGLFDQDGSELDLDLDLELELADEPQPEVPSEPEAGPEPPRAPEPASEEHSAVTETADQPAVDPEPAPPPAEPPIESLDTVEHHFEEAIEDTGEAEIVEGELADEPEAGQEEDEDVLEETPEFLRDAPEDDELWFEQGEPKDFDF